MPLAYRITALADAHEALRGHYKPDATGGFVLDLDGFELGAELKRANTHAESLNGEIDRLMREHAASDISREISRAGSERVLVPLITERLRVELRDGVRTVVVVDQRGMLSASSLDDLKRELRGNKAFAPVIGNGTAAHGTQVTGPNTITRKQFDEMTQAERTAHFRGGGSIVNGDGSDASAADTPRRDPAQTTVSRKVFETWPASDRMEHVKAGGAIN